MSNEEPQVAANAPQDELEETHESAAASPLDGLMDISLPLVVEIGRTRMTVEQILQLGNGSVVELDRMAGDAVDIFIGDKKLAEGQVVVVGENFGVRISRVVDVRGKEVGS